VRVGGRVHIAFGASDDHELRSHWYIVRLRRGPPNPEQIGRNETPAAALGKRQDGSG
jgi:hypothetical protein